MFFCTKYKWIWVCVFVGKGQVMSTFTNFIRNKGFMVVVVMLLITAIVGDLLLNSSDHGVSVTAMIKSEDGISPRSDFLITIKDDPEETELRERVELDPPVGYSVLRDENSEWRLRPDSPLAPNSELAIIVDGQRFKFTVRNELFVTSLYPAPTADKVALRSGIEVTFNSDKIKEDDIHGALKFEPEILYVLQRNGNRYIFSPIEEMLPETTYTVTIGTELNDENGAVLYEPVHWSFTTMAKQNSSYDEAKFFVAGGSFSINALTSETPIMQFYMSDNVSSFKNVHTDIYSFDNADSYRAALQEKMIGSLESIGSDDLRAGLTKFAEFESELIKSNDSYSYRNSGKLLFPEALPEGWYAVYVTAGSKNNPIVREVLLQVTDVSVFFALTGDDVIVWTNDAATGKPIANASAEFAGSRIASAVTDDKGIALIKNVKTLDNNDYNNKAKILFTVKAGERTFIGDSQFYDYYRNDETEKYMVSVYTDRAIYMTTDTINVWGVVRPWNDDTPLPQNLTLNLGWNDTLVNPVSLAADGTFQTTIQLENMAASEWTSLILMEGERSLYYTLLTITDYVKPVYTSSSGADETVYMITGNNEVSATIEVSMFDGTPAPAMALRTEVWRSDRISVTGDSGNIVTDEDGRATAKWKVSGGHDSWYPTSFNYRFSSNQAESENFYNYGSVYVIARDVMLTAKRVQNNSTDILISTNRVDISGIEKTEDLWKKDALKGAVLSQEVTVELHKTYYTKSIGGEYYDYVNRTMRSFYNYEYHDDVVSINTYTTQNGEYLLKDLPEPTRDASYYIIVTTKDSLGRTVRTSTYLGSIYSMYGGYNDGIHRYSLTVRPDPNNSVEADEDPDFYYYWRSDQFEDNEAVLFDLRNNDELVEEKTGRILSFIVQDEISKINVVDGNEFTMPFDEDLLPNYMLTGAYFNGKHIFPLSDTYLYYDPAQRELDIEVAPEKESYAPGETMQANVTVRNAYTGKFSPNTTVLLSVVDEAIFALREQYTNILDDLYEMMYFPNVYKYVSYTQFLPDQGAGEKGGGGGDEGQVREDFKDAAFFQTVKTDENGNATVSVKLPDNITSWRVTSLALSPDNRAGNDKMNITATLPYFVMPIVNPELLVGDSFTVGLYSAGRDVNSSDAVSYTIRLQGNGVDLTENINSTVRGYASIDLGKFGKGDYTVTVEGSCGSYKDAVKLPVSIINTGIEVSLVETVNLADDIKIDPLRYPVSIMFYSENAKSYNTVRGNVIANARYGRTEARISRKFIAAEYQKSGYKWYNEAALTDNLDDLSSYRPLPILPQAQPDVEVTLKAWLAAENIKNINLYSCTPEERTADTIGRMSASRLASALVGGEQDARVIEKMLAEDISLDYIDKMYLTMALHTLGEIQSAQKHYQELVVANRTELMGISGSKAYFITDPEGNCNVPSSTATALMLATMMKHEDAHSFATWLAEKREWSSYRRTAYYTTDEGRDYEPYLLEQVYYLRSFSPAGGTDEFSYMRDGQKISKKLNSMAAVNFNKSQLAEAAFNVESGVVYADIFYSGEPSQVADESRKLIPVTKTIEVVGGGEMKPGALVKITITPDFSAFDADIGDTCVVIDEYIPTGMRFERYVHSDRKIGWYLASRQQQRLQFSVYGVGSCRGLGEIIYYARCATPGDYVVESAYVSSSTSDIWGASDRSTVVISE